MSTTYERMTLGMLIRALRNLPEGARVRGLGFSVNSYRGYYERNAIGPNTHGALASRLADIYEEQIGNPIEGYKGGDYNVSADELVYLADYGDTGPCIIGFQEVESGLHEPVLLEQDYHF